MTNRDVYDIFLKEPKEDKSHKKLMKNVKSPDNQFRYPSRLVTDSPEESDYRYTDFDDCVIAVSIPKKR